MPRVLLHSDANSYYASVECLYTPALRGKPMAVCGSAEERHGIVLAKSEAAKARGVQTGMAIWQAKKACPGLICVPPDYELYLHFSAKLRRIYESYTPLVEPFGLDECWLDITQPGVRLAEGERVAQELRQRIRRELGLTVSIGVAENKVFAKLASDLRKPDAVTVISAENFRSVAWPLPARDLLYVGPRTAEKLAHAGIRTIGGLALADTGMLEYRLGKNGVMLQAFALGLDRSPVRAGDAREAFRSIGNSATPPRDIQTPQEARWMLHLLADSVCERLRALGLRAGQVSVSLRDGDLAGHSCQKILAHATHGTGQIAQAACKLLEERLLPLLPYRSMGLHCGGLKPENAPVQLDFWGEEAARAERLDRALDSLLYRFGPAAIRRASSLADTGLSRVELTGQRVHPAAFLREGCVRYDQP